MKSDQLSFLAPADMPEGLAYAPDFLTEAEEAALAGRLDMLDFKPFEFHGFLGKRQTVSFGWSYRFDGSGLGAADADSGLAEAGPRPRRRLCRARARRARTCFAGQI